MTTERIAKLDDISQLAVASSEVPNTSFINSSLDDIRGINRGNAEGQPNELAKLTIVADSGSTPNSGDADYYPPDRGAPAHRVDGAPSDRSSSPLPATRRSASSEDESYVPPRRGAPANRANGAV